MAVGRIREADGVSVPTVLQHVDEMAIDYDAEELSVRTVDGSVHRQRGLPLQSRGPVADFRKVRFNPRTLITNVETRWNECFDIEVFDRGNQRARRNARPVVYLDQNKWVQLALFMHRPERLSAKEREATGSLVEMVEAQQVILALSGGHWIETGPVYGDRRKKLATEMVGLSRGWIMSCPLLVRAAELDALFSGDRDTALGHIDDSVFTLDHHQLFAAESGRYTPREPGLPTEIVELIDALSSAESTVAVLLENERTHSAEGAAAARGWAALHADFAEQIAADRSVPALARRLTLARFLTDLGIWLAAAFDNARLSESEARGWLESRADSDIAALPYLGRMREVIHLRLMNRRDPWDPNDLVDLMFLPCAAGYADHLVCEKKTAHHLEQANRDRAGGAVVHSNVSELISVLAA